MELPEIHEAARLRLEPGDILVLRNNEIEIDQQQMADIKAHVRAVLGLPNLPVLVLGRDWDVEAVAPGAETTWPVCGTA
jgi:hypothetical protein